MDNIILIGMPGAGKSTVGVLLAKTLGYAFLDTDLEAFLDVEADAICSVECRGTGIAPGGSAVCRERAMSHLRALGRIVYLHLPLEELERRLSNISTRGIAMAPGETLADLFARRAPLYRNYADLTVDVGRQSLEETAALVLRALR